MRARLGARRGVVVAVAAVLALVLVLAVVGARAGRRPTAAGSGSPVGRTATVVVASDSFERSVDGGWGSADLGGEWRSDSLGALSVAAGTGSIRFKAGAGTTVSLSSVQPPDLKVAFDVSAPDLATAGGGVYTGVEVRSSGGYFYQCNLRLTRGDAFLSIVRQDGLVAKPRVLAREHRVATGVKPGQVFHVVCQASGASPVQLFATAIRGDQAREWQVRAVDDTASRIVGGGQIGLRAYVSGSASRPQQVRFDELTVTALSASDAAAPPGSSGGGSGSPSPSKGAASAPRAVLPQAKAVRFGRAGSRPVGSTDYPVPTGALYVSTTGGAAGDGSRSNPFATLAAAVASAGDGATIVLRGGSYHESVVLPPDRQLTVQSYPHEAVWLDGSTEVVGWRRSGSTWVAAGWDRAFDASPTYTQGAAEDPRPGWQFVNAAHPMAAHPDQVWIDGAAQRQVASRDEVGSRDFYVDETAKELVIGADPRSREVRASALSTALTVLGEGDVVRGVGVRRYATSVWQLGAVTLNVPGIRLADVVLEQNATTGVSVIAPDADLDRITSRGNGLMGVHANNADGLRVDGLSATGNNTEHFNRAPAAGGMKVTTSGDVKILDSEFDHNRAHGLWCDESCADLIVGRSRFERNEGSGLVLEISSGATIAGNLFRGNGLDGLWTIDSDRVEAAGNAFVDNHRSSVTLSQDDRWTTSDGVMPWILRDVLVYDNVVRQSGNGCAVCLDDRGGLLGLASTSIRFDHDVYQRTEGPRRAAAVPEADRTPTRDLLTTLADQEVHGSRVTEEQRLVDDGETAGPAAARLVTSVARPVSAAVSRTLGTGCSSRVLGPAC